MPGSAEKGLLIVLSAPSGTGKTTIAHRVMAGMPGVSRSVSYTTRKMRDGEVNGKDYHFIEKEIFKRMIDNDKFIEWAEVHGNYYGTAFANIKSVIETGRDLMLVIDVQGAESLRKKKIEGVYIFLLPPSMAELDSRLHGRGQDSDEVINRRMEIAKGEIARWDEYDYGVVNGDLDMAAMEVESIIRAEKRRVHRIYRQFEDYELP